MTANTVVNKIQLHLIKSISPSVQNKTNDIYAFACWENETLKFSPNPVWSWLHTRIAYVFTLEEKIRGRSSILYVIRKENSQLHWLVSQQMALAGSVPVVFPSHLCSVQTQACMLWFFGVVTNTFFLEAALHWLFLLSSLLSRGRQMTSPAEVLLPSTWTSQDPLRSWNWNFFPHAMFCYLALSKDWSKEWGWGEGNPFYP